MMKKFVLPVMILIALASTVSAILLYRRAQTLERERNNYFFYSLMQLTDLGAKAHEGDARRIAAGCDLLITSLQSVLNRFQSSSAHAFWVVHVRNYLLRHGLEISSETQDAYAKISSQQPLQPFEPPGLDGGIQK